MSEKKTQKSYPKEFKEEAVALVTDFRSSKRSRRTTPLIYYAEP